MFTFDIYSTSIRRRFFELMLIFQPPSSFDLPETLQELAGTYSETSLSKASTQQIIPYFAGIFNSFLISQPIVNVSFEQNKIDTGLTAFYAELSKESSVKVSTACFLMV